MGKDALVHSPPAIERIAQAGAMASANFFVANNSDYRQYVFDETGKILFRLRLEREGATARLEYGWDNL